MNKDRRTEQIENQETKKNRRTELPNIRQINAPTCGIQIQPRLVRTYCSTQLYFFHNSTSKPPRLDYLTILYFAKYHSVNYLLNSTFHFLGLTVFVFSVLWLFFRSSGFLFIQSSGLNATFCRSFLFKKTKNKILQIQN